jgi:hypothetical protein
VPLGPLRRLGLAPLGLLASSLGLAPLGLLASSLGLAPLGLRLNPLSSADGIMVRLAGLDMLKAQSVLLREDKPINRPAHKECARRRRV